MHPLFIVAALAGTLVSIAAQTCPPSAATGLFISPSIPDRLYDR